ncbi:cytochrome P450 [Micromonospora wenchangensis]|uniref:cytochrome P450 n=1 Tax=Micromonospora wenchangensis TaxID=1185415 RepID=UPI003D734BBB
MTDPTPSAPDVEMPKKADTVAYPMARTCPLHQPDAYAEMSARRPVSVAELPSGRPVWLVASHQLAREILTDPRISANRFHPGFPHMFRSVPSQPPSDAVRHAHSLIGRAFAVDGPEHSTRKKLIISDFTVRRVQTLRPRIQEIVDRCLDRMLAGDNPTDLVQAFALPVPSEVISELLNVPLADREFYLERTRIMVDHASTVEQRQQANLDVLGKLDALITARETAPEDDVLSRLVQRNQNTETLSHDEVVGMAAFLLISGFETTANMIAMGTIGLLENPDQLALLKADPSLSSGAVEELLRYFSVSDPAGSRVALENINIGGETIPAGAGVIALAGAANWDESVFEHPERIDIRRDARAHLAFGHGAHQCIGLNLARLELDVVFSTLFRRLPGLRLERPSGELRYKEHANIYGVYEVPVSW